MATQHGEMGCPHRQVHGHGKRRRRCADCGKTWTLWKRRRGPKSRPRRTRRLKRTFSDKIPLAQQAKRAGMKPSTFNARHRQVLTVFKNQPWIMPLPKIGNLLLLADGKWYVFAGKRWTLYLLALRPVESIHAVFLPPLLLQGTESLEGWRRMIHTIPIFLLKRIKALISDSFCGVETIRDENGWVLQRCHFHLHASFQCMLGKNKNVSFGKGRRQIYGSVRRFLVTTDPRTLFKERDAIARCSRNRRCPLRLRRSLRGLLRREDEFRAYIRYPDLRLPSTSNVMESMNARLNDLEGRCHGFRSPTNLLQWATAEIRHHQTMKCHPKNLQN